MHADRTYIWLLGILAVALGLRVAAAVMVQQHVSRTPGRLCLIAGDAEGYWELGRKLAHGQPYEIYDPPRRILRMPGFPVILAVSIAVFGDSPGAARLLLAIVGTLACGGVYYLGAALFERRIGLIAAAIAAVSPTFIATSAMLLSETTFALGVMLSLIPLAWLMRPAEQVPDWKAFGIGVLAGVGGAAACYARPSWLLFPPAAMGCLILLALVDRRKQGSSRLLRPVMMGTAGTALGLLLALAPWTCRNYFVSGGHFVPTTLWMGPSLYDGLNPEANGDSNMEFLKRDGLYEKLTEYEVDQHYRREAWKWAGDHPARALQLAWIKFCRYWNLWPNTPQFDHWLVRLVLLMFLVPVIACTIWGLIVGRSARVGGTVSYGWVIFLTVGPILYFSALHMLFVGSLRYRLPAEYPMLVLTAVGIQDLVRRMSPQKVREPGDVHS